MSQGVSDCVTLYLLKEKKNRLSKTPEYKKALSLVQKIKRSYDGEQDDNDICIVVDDLPSTNQVEFIQELVAACKNYSKNVVTFSGYRFIDVNAGTLKKKHEIRLYDRMPFTPRFRRNDTGDVQADVLTRPCFACRGNILNTIAASSNILDLKNVSITCSVCNIEIMCVDPKSDWSGLPFLNRDNLLIMKMDSDENMPLFVYNGWQSKNDTITPYDSDYVAVIITTHNRTDTALTTIDSLVKHIKYDKLVWILADDRSDENHIDSLLHKFKDLGIEDPVVTRTNKEHWGLGASLNNALREAFKLADIVLTTEDDWYLQYDLDLKEFVDVLKDNRDVAAIRLGTTHLVSQYLVPWHDARFSSYSMCSYLADKDRGAYILNNQVAIRHRRLYDSLGFYKENAPADAVENDLNKRYESNPKLCVLWPNKYQTTSLVCNENPFIHFGKSTVGHVFDDLGLGIDIVNARLASPAESSIHASSNQAPFFRVIIPVHESTSTLKRALKSISDQTFKNYIVSVCDDGSIESSRLENEKSVNTILGNRGVFQFHEKPLFAGAARNTAMSISKDSEYTLFLDADDNFTYPRFFEELHVFILRNGFPDAIPLPYVHEGKEHVSDILKINTPAAFSLTCTAPWRKCLKTSKVCEFNTGLRKSNDVVQHLRQADNVDTVRPFYRVCVSYNSDGETTTFGKNKNKNLCNLDSLRAVFRVCSDVLDETYKHEYMREAVEKQILFKVNNMIPGVVRTLGKGGIAKLVKIAEK